MFQLSPRSGARTGKRGVLQGLFKRNRVIQSLVNYRMIDPVTKITYRRDPPDCDTIRICCRRRDVNKLWHLLRDMRYSPLSTHDSGMTGTIDSPQWSTHSFNRSSMVQAGGRFWGSWACCTTHIATNSSHNVSENPEGGLSGRVPPTTLKITVSLRVTLANGTHPVRT